jgi:hypothetical protein
MNHKKRLALPCFGDFLFRILLRFGYSSVEIILLLTFDALGFVSLLLGCNLDIVKRA